MAKKLCENMAKKYNLKICAKNIPKNVGTSNDGIIVSIITLNSSLSKIVHAIPRLHTCAQLRFLFEEFLFKNGLSRAIFVSTMQLFFLKGHLINAQNTIQPQIKLLSTPASIFLIITPASRCAYQRGIWISGS